jgi:lipid-A-disaccharide synthase
MTHIFMFAGELSGDTHGGMLLHALRQQLPKQIIATGVGGPAMRAQGLAGALAMEDFEVMGFTDVLWNLPRLRRQFNQIRDYIIDTDPQVVLFIDSPSFSLRMAKVLRKRGHKGKLVQYICPSVWAWGKERVEEIARDFDLLLTILPFEHDYFAHTKLRVQYVGHPTTEALRSHTYHPHWEKNVGIKDHKEIVALFPGSRKAEIQRNLPKQLQAAQLIKKQCPETLFGISCSNEHNKKLVQQILKQSSLKCDHDTFLIPRLHTYDLMRSSRSAIAKSGTVTLELALHACPTVVVYELSLLNRLIAQYLLRVNLPHYCIVNILANKRVFPELITCGFTPDNLYNNLMHLHKDNEVRKECISDCHLVRHLLKEENVSERAAQAILQLLI